MAGQLFTEKREYPRMTLNRLVRIKEESGKTKQLVAINYSLCGMALHSNVPLPFGEFFEMRFRVDEHNMNVLDMTAEVMQNFKKGNAYIIGVKFVGELPFNPVLT